MAALARPGTSQTDHGAVQPADRVEQPVGSAQPSRNAWSPSQTLPTAAWWLPVAAFGGGQVGSRLLRDRLPASVVRTITGFLLLLVAGLLLKQVLA